jgi:hypothetical protein
MNTTKTRKWPWIAGLGAVLAVGGCAAGAAGSSGGSTPATQAPASSAPSAPPAQSAPPAPAAPAPTVAQQQALDSAQGYLSMGSGFSRLGLLDQLTSSAGEGFATADAKWAIRHAHPDWNAQAVESAKGYLKMGGFSRASLIDQLSSSAGEQFTVAQATYAADQVGL